MSEQHSLMGGKLHIYRRANSGCWQCSTFLNGKNWRVSTKEESLAHAKDFAEDWFLELKGKSRAGELKVGKTFKFAAEQFLREVEVLTAGERSPYYVRGHRDRLRVHLVPFFGNKILSEITPGLVQEYRIHRATAKRDLAGAFVKPARSTIHQEIVSLRQVLKTANRNGWLAYLPSLAAPYRASGKVSHRGWFSLEEYRTLYTATRRRAADPPKKRWRWSCEQLHDYVLFMANTGLRPDEASRLEFRDVVVVDDEATGEQILEIEVRGKRGIGYCKSMPGAIAPFDRLSKRLRANNVGGRTGEGRSSVAREPAQGRRLPEPTDRIFPQTHRELFNEVLREEGLKKDRDGQWRTAYSLRHTYICFRLMEGADIYQVAKNCRTSVEMVEKFYASHLKNTLNAAAINVKRAKPRRQAQEKAQRPPKVNARR